TALELEADLFALDATVIELSVALFPWARWKTDHASVKLNVLLDLQGDIPVFAAVYDGDRHEIASLDQIPVQRGSYYVMDRGYLDFTRLFALHQAGAFFVTRMKTNTQFYVAQSRPVDEATGLRCDQTIRLNTYLGKKAFPEPLRRIRYVDPETQMALVFITNQFALDALTIALIYKQRWAIETFFRWLKQHLRLRGFFSTSPNGVRVQIWTALCAYLLVAIAKQRNRIPHSLWEILQVVSVSSLEQVPLRELLTKNDTRGHYFDGSSLFSVGSRR
ncbi:MAG: IS4 family transposase, partial [Phycisphaerae bacterium]